MLVDYILPDLQSNLKRGPQIISPKDIAWIVYKSGLSTGKIDINNLESIHAYIMDEFRKRKLPLKNIYFVDCR